MTDRDPSVSEQATEGASDVEMETTGRALRAVVTGASTGIGAATVRGLRAAGWDVVATARRADRLEALAAETGCTWVAADLTDEADVARLAATVLEGGGVTSLVNNAGGAVGLDPVSRSGVADWAAMYEKNVLATLRVTQALLPALEADGGGDLLFVTSTAAHGSYPGGAGYTAAKHAEREIATTLRLDSPGARSGCWRSRPVWSRPRSSRSTGSAATPSGPPRCTPTWRSVVRSSPRTSPTPSCGCSPGRGTSTSTSWCCVRSRRARTPLSRGPPSSGPGT